jgi:hypothetical protein
MARLLQYQQNQLPTSDQGASPTAEPEGWTDDCTWPRRLLHVPTMTSQQWCRGNRYGTSSRPKYNALSYTWGRYKLDEEPAKARPDVSAITIRGEDEHSRLSWPIPRIDPAHFTADEFANVIRDASEPHPQDPNAPPVEYLWLDVACIDQREDSPEMASEIGRQAKIFRRASRTYVWLTTKSANDMLLWARELDKYFGLMIGKDFHANVDLYDWTKAMARLIKELKGDPWFSSTWTLQESFLCPNAILLFGDSRKSTMDLSTLKMLSDMMSAVSDAMTYKPMIPLDTNFRLSACINEAGFLDGVKGNPMGLLTASRHRQASREEDRVYGVMQVFDLKLGKAAPGADPLHKYSLSELYDQLGAELMRQYSVLSQLHQHGSPTVIGKAWRIGNDSFVPDYDARKIYQHMQYNGKIDCWATLSTQEIDGSLWGKYSGPVIAFQTFEKWLTRDWPGAWILGDARILLDRTGSHDLLLPTHGTSDRVRALLLNVKFPGSVIVLLGLHFPRADSKKASERTSHAIGLLLAPLQLFVSEEYRVKGVPCDDRGIKPWRRLGIFIWSIEDERLASTASEKMLSEDPYREIARDIELALPRVRKHLPYLQGRDNAWKFEEGLFG